MINHVLITARRVKAYSAWSSYGVTRRCRLSSIISDDDDTCFL